MKNNTKKKEYYFTQLWCQWCMYMCIVKGYIKCYFSDIEKKTKFRVQACSIAFSG